MSSLIVALANQTAVQQALRSFADNLEAIAAQIVSVQQIPAPTFAEAARADYIETQFAAAGLTDVIQDDLHNVYGRLPGYSPELAPVILSAHLDTVFPAETNLAHRRDGSLLFGPGMADNSAAVAGLLIMAKTLCQWPQPLTRDIWFVANVGEEGLGDLRGMKCVVERFGSAHAYIVLEGGAFGRVIHQGVCAHRLRITATTPGGHSWADYGRPSAIHTLGRLIASLDSLSTPVHPKTSYNVGQISGGISINTIAPQAEMLLDLRSVDPQTLADLTAQLHTLLAAAGQEDGVTLTSVTIGQRPGGQLDRHAPLVQWATEALHQVGCRHVDYAPGSTDANVPFSLGYAAVCVGLATAAHVHHPDEQLDLTSLPHGLGQLLLLLLATATWQEPISR